MTRTFAVPSAFGIISRCFNPRLAAYEASASFISIPTILLLVRKVRKVITWSLSVLIDSGKMDHRVDGLVIAVSPNSPLGPVSFTITIA